MLCFFLQSVVQSYLEGVDWGLGQLREARAELREVSHAMNLVRLESSKNAENINSLDALRDTSIDHCQLLAAVTNLPHLHSGLTSFYITFTCIYWEDIFSQGKSCPDLEL